MSYGVVHQFKGGTKDQYEASIAAVHPADGGLPAGQVFHAAGPSEDGSAQVQRSGGGGGRQAPSNTSRRERREAARAQAKAGKGSRRR